MAQITVSGLSDRVKEAYKEIAQRYNISIAEAARPALNDWAANHADDLPEHVAKDVNFEKLTDENRWKMRVLYFRPNVRETLQEMLEREPTPHPDKVEWGFIESCRHELKQQCPEEWRDEDMDFLAEEMERYRIHYYAERPEEAPHSARDRDELIAYCQRHIEAGRVDLAVEYAESMAERGQLPAGMSADVLITEARAETAKDHTDTLTPDQR